MYKEPIKISANDPICSATALEGTIIGILFDKTGADIQAAIDYAAQAGKVGVVGYCWGGLLTWRSACLLNGVSAAVH